jgi:apolipoprotein N-acyltransferase
VGEPKYAEQATAMTVVRAIEQRRALVRASTAGPSAIVAPSGRVTARTAAFTAATLHGTVAPRLARTVYARVGDLFALVCALATLAACVRPR